MATKTKPPIKLIGELVWVPEEEIQGPNEVKRGIFRSPDEIVLDCVSQAPITISNSIASVTTILEEHGRPAKTRAGRHPADSILMKKATS